MLLSQRESTVMDWLSRLGRIWPLRVIRDRIEWKRRDREERVVATDDYSSKLSDNGKPTEVLHTHILLFLIDGNGTRYTRTESTDKKYAAVHRALLTARVNWVHHGEIPSSARRTDNNPRGKLVVLPGGAA